MAKISINSNSAAKSAAVDSVLNGKKVLLIGGDPRPCQQSAMEQQLGVAELRWYETRPTTSLSRLQKIVASEQYDIVILALRWARHRFSELAHVCKHHRIGFVRLPGGINPNQIAFRANDQISRR